MEIQLVAVAKIFFSLAFVYVFALCIHLYNSLFLKPERLRSQLRKQGIKGPPPSFLYGNRPEMKKMLIKVAKSPPKEKPPQNNETHDPTSFLFPYLEQWMKEYGSVFTFSFGNLQVLYLTDPEVVKEICLCTSLDLGKPSYQRREFESFLGNGILTANGPEWAYQRKVIAPELYMERIRGMVNLMVEAANIVIKSWDSKIESEGGVADIKADVDLQTAFSFVISKTMFGNNHAKGTEIFLKGKTIKDASVRPALLSGIPGMRYLPTKNNRERWRLKKEVCTTLLKMAKDRTDHKASEKDLFQSIIEGAKNGDLGADDANHFIVDNSKNIFDAGFETTVITGSWALMLLASHPEWQDRARAEAVEVLGGNVPDADLLRKMKTITMVIQETLRLYPPAMLLTREAFDDMKFGDIHVPKGMNIWLPVLSLHYDPENWGPDAHKFNPERFANGLKSACKFPHSYMPFGVGPRLCAGQHFATVELKITLALILQKFSFTVSPQYRHSPYLRIVLEPKYGVNLMVKRL